MRERAQAARLRSRELVARCIQLAQVRRENGTAGDRWSAYTAVEQTLRQSVREYAGLLRLIEHTPEAAVIELKQVVQDGLTGLEGDHLAQRDLTASVVEWAIEAYFEAAN